jgi:hypothetical protein
MKNLILNLSFIAFIASILLAVSPAFAEQAESEKNFDAMFQEVMEPENLLKGIEQYKANIDNMLKKSDRGLGRFFLKKFSREMLLSAGLDPSNRRVLGEQVRGILENEQLRDIASEMSYAPMYAMSLLEVENARGKFRTFLCRTGQFSLRTLSMGLMVTGFIAFASVNYVAAGFPVAIAMVIGGVTVGGAGLYGGYSLMEWTNTRSCN